MAKDIFGFEIPDDNKNRVIKRRGNGTNDIDREISRRKKRAEKEARQIDAFNRTGRRQFELDFVDEIVSECLDRFKKQLIKENKQSTTHP